MNTESEWWETIGRKRVNDVLTLLNDELSILGLDELEFVFDDNPLDGRLSDGRY